VVMALAINRRSLIDAMKRCRSGLIVRSWVDTAQKGRHGAPGGIRRLFRRQRLFARLLNAWSIRCSAGTSGTSGYADQNFEVAQAP
jgi:hypothetical protein